MTIKLFNSLSVYRLGSDFQVPKTEHLNGALFTRQWRKPSATELNTIGFIEPLGESDVFAQPVGSRSTLFAMHIQTRMLPGKIVNEHVRARIKAIEQEQDRKVYSKERREIKEEVVTKLLPQAFIDRKTVHAMLSPPYIFVDTTSAKTAETLLSCLREVLGSLGVRPVRTKISPVTSFTHWATDQVYVPQKFRVTGDFKANNVSDEKDSVTGKGTDLHSETLSDWLREEGRRVVQIGAVWNGQMDEAIPFTVNDSVVLKGIKWPEAITDQGVADAGEDASQIDYFKATLLLVEDELVNLVEELLDVLGGEELPDTPGRPDDDVEDNVDNLV